MKSQALLTIALFLVCAPAPDSTDIAELTSNFIVPENQPGLSASEAGTDVAADRENQTALVGKQQGDRPATTAHNAAGAKAP